MLMIEEATFLLTEVGKWRRCTNDREWTGLVGK